MRKYFWFVTVAVAFALTLVSRAHAGEGLYLPNIKGFATGTTVLGKNYLDVSASISEVAVGAPGTAVPGQIKVVGGYDGVLIRTLLTDSLGQLQVGVTSSALPTGAATEATLSTLNGKVTTTANGIKVDGSSVTQPVSAVSLPLPSGAATYAAQTDGTQKTQIVDGLGAPVDTRLLNSGVTGTDVGLVTNTVIHGLSTGGGGVFVDVKANPSGALSVDASGSTVSVTSSALPTGAATEATLSTLNGKVTTTANGVKVDGSAVTQPISAASLPLPTGATTEATLSALSAKFGSLGQKAMAGSAPVVIASDQSNIPVNQTQVGGAAVSLGSKTSANSYPVVIASDQAGVQIKMAMNSTGSGSAAGATVSTVITLSAPANAVGFVLQALDTNTANLRWAVGRTATTTLGQQLQPGRDTGFIPVGANVSLVAESGTQGYDIQWISQ